MNTLPLLIGALCVYALAYRYYSAFIAAKAMALDDRRTTPAHAFADGHNYVATPRWVLFGHHFAAIAGAGPLVGPTLAAQFGFLPGFLWLLIGAVVAGCVQDFTVLVASLRHRGRSVADIARTEISPFAGLVSMIAVLFILIVTLAGLGIVVVNALSNSPWGVFTIGMTIPIALIMGLWMFRSQPGKVIVTGPSVFGVVLLIASVIAGHWFALSGAAGWLTFTPHEVTGLMAIYGLVASVLPVWLLLQPRDYLSTYVKLGTIAILVVGVFIVHPDIKFPNVTPVRERRRTDHQRQAFSILVRHHCLRSHLRFSFTRFLGHNAQDARQGDGCAHDRVWCDAVRVAGGRAGVDRRVLHAPGRLLCHQHGSRGIQPSSVCRR